MKTGRRTIAQGLTCSKHWLSKASIISGYWNTWILDRALKIIYQVSVRQKQHILDWITKTKMVNASTPADPGFKTIISKLKNRSIESQLHAWLCTVMCPWVRRIRETPKCKVNRRFIQLDAPPSRILDSLKVWDFAKDLEGPQCECIMAELGLYKVFASFVFRGKELAEGGVEKANRIIATLK